MLKTFFSNNGQKMSRYRWFSLWLSCMIKDLGVTRTSLGNPDLPASSALWALFCFCREKICPCSVKQSNQLFCIMKYSFYNYWHFRQLCHMSIVVWMLTSGLWRVGQDSSGLTRSGQKPLFSQKGIHYWCADLLSMQTSTDLRMCLCFNKKS